MGVIIYLEFEIKFRKLVNSMDRTKESLNSFVGLNRTVDHLMKIVKKDVQRHGLNVTEFAVMELLITKATNRYNVLVIEYLLQVVVYYVVDKLEERDASVGNVMNKINV